MKEEKEAEELEEKDKAKAKMMHGEWMQKTLGKVQKGAKRASWSLERSGCEVLDTLERLNIGTPYFDGFYVANYIHQSRGKTTLW